jgi:hypothetical protein
MPDVDIEHEIQRLADEIGKPDEEAELRQMTGTPIVDVGADNMIRTAELLVQATREGAAELAKRFALAGSAMVDEATRTQNEIHTFNKRLLDHTEVKAREFSDIFQRFRTAALALTQVMEALAVPLDREPKQ